MFLAEGDSKKENKKECYQFSSLISKMKISLTKWASNQGFSSCLTLLTLALENGGVLTIFKH